MSSLACLQAISRSAQFFSKKDSPRDWFWGIGADGTGSNELGKALMRLRDELRAFAFRDSFGV